MNLFLEILCLIFSIGFMVYAIYHFKVNKWEKLYIGLLAIIVSIYGLVLSIGLMVLKV